MKYEKKKMTVLNIKSRIKLEHSIFIENQEERIKSNLSLCIPKLDKEGS